MILSYWSWCTVGIARKGVDDEFGHFLGAINSYTSLTLWVTKLRTLLEDKGARE